MILKSIKCVLGRIWHVLIYVRKDRTGTGKFGAFFPNPKENKRVFDTSVEVLIDGKKYLVERHFTGTRDVRQAVYSTVENEAKRENEAIETA